MKRLLSLLVLAAASAMHADTPTITLSESIAITLSRSEVILNALENEKQAELEIISRSTAGYPEVYLKGDFTRRDELPGGFGGSFGADAQTQDYYLSLKQPIYHGLRNVVATKAARALLEARKADVATQHLALKNETVQRFFAVLDTRLQHELTNTAITLQQASLDVLRKRQEAGDVRRSDVLQAENSLQELLIEQTTLAEIEGEARQNLAFLVGESANNTLVDPEQKSNALNHPEKLVHSAFQNRTELTSLEHQAAAAELALDIVQRESHPDLDLEVNGYGYREGFLEEARWDAKLTLTWELTGRKDRNARADQERSKAEQVRLAVSDAQKQIARDVYIAVNKIQQSQKIQEQRTIHAAKASELHEIVKEEYDAGEATALEVQSAFTDMRRSQQYLQREKLREQRLHYQLLLITGEDPWSATP